MRLPVSGAWSVWPSISNASTPYPRPKTRGLADFLLLLSPFLPRFCLPLRFVLLLFLFPSTISSPLSCLHDSRFVLSDRLLGNHLLTALGLGARGRWNERKYLLFELLGQYGVECLVVDDAHDLSMPHLIFLKELTDHLFLSFPSYPLGLCLVTAGRGASIPLKDVFDQPETMWMRRERETRISRRTRGASAKRQEKREAGQEKALPRGTRTARSEMSPNLRPIVLGLKVRTRGPQPSICVRTFSLFTS
jgi:hypothetical protein